MNPKCEQYKLKMEKTIEVMKHEFSTIRAGRANVAVLDKITESMEGPLNKGQIMKVLLPKLKNLGLVDGKMVSEIVDKTIVNTK